MSAVRVSVIADYNGGRRIMRLQVERYHGQADEPETLTWFNDEDIQSFFEQCDRIRADLIRDGWLERRVR